MSASEICRVPVINHTQEALSLADRLGQKRGRLFLAVFVCGQAGGSCVPELFESCLIGTHLSLTDDETSNRTNINNREKLMGFICQYGPPQCWFIGFQCLCKLRIMKTIYVSALWEYSHGGLTVYW